MRGFALVLVLIGLASLLFAPLPYYQKQDGYCESYPSILCSKKGWHLGSSLWDKIYPYIVPQITRQTPSNSNPPMPPPTTNHPYKEPSISSELKAKYFPIWKEVFLNKNDMIEDYFAKHIVIENISQQEWNEGESMYIRYLVNIGWSSSRLDDKVLLRPKGGLYFTQDQVKQNLLTDKGDALYQNQVSRIIPLETTPPFEDIVKSLKFKCHQSLSAGETRVEQGLNRGYGELHLYAEGVVDERKNICKSATVRVKDVEILSCLDTPCRIY